MSRTRAGARTYFWQRTPQVLDTLDTADLSLLEGARILYVDWYDGDHILRAMDEAMRLGVPVFLNFEHGHADPELLKRYGRPGSDLPGGDRCRPAWGGTSTGSGAQTCWTSACKTALITHGGRGLPGGAAVREVVRVHAPSVEAVDGCGAGATFSAGYIYGHLKGWSLEESVRFATAAASLKVTRPGLQMFPIDRDQGTGCQLQVEQLQLGRPISVIGEFFDQLRHPSHARQQVERMHAASLEILENVGLLVRNEKARFDL